MDGRSPSAQKMVNEKGKGLAGTSGSMETSEKLDSMNKVTSKTYQRRRITEKDLIKDIVTVNQTAFKSTWAKEMEAELDSAAEMVGPMAGPAWISRDLGGDISSPWQEVEERTPETMGTDPKEESEDKKTCRDEKLVWQ